MANYNKKKNIGKIIAGILCGVLCVTAVAGAGTALYMGAKNNGWFDSEEEVVEEPDTDIKETTEEGALEINTIKSSRISLTSTPVLTAGTVSGSTTSTTLKATVTPSDAIGVSLVWEVAFKNASSTWASGKTVTDYVTITPSSDTLSATLTCKQAFGEQIIVKVYSSSDDSISATATADYYLRPSDASIYLYAEDYDNNSDSSNWENTIFNMTSSSATTSIKVYSLASSYKDYTNVYYDLQGSLIANVSTSGSTGTKSDTWTATSYTISQNSSYTCWSGYGNGSYTFTSYTDFSYSAMLLKLFYSSGYSPVTAGSTLKTTYYNTFASYSSSPIATLTVTYTGKNSGLTYSVDYGICFDFSSYSTVTAVSLNTTSIAF